MLQLISLLVVIYSYFLIHTHLPNLPRLIPTHFNASGAADGWGSPETLWFLLGVQILTSVVFLAVPYLGQRFPRTVHLGRRRLSDYSSQQQLRILPLLGDMMGYLSILTNVFFTFMLYEIIQAAAQPMPHIHLFRPMGLLLGGMFGITFYYLAQFRRAANGDDDGNSSPDFTP